MTRKPWKGNYTVFTVQRDYEQNADRVNEVKTLIGVYPTINEALFIQDITIKEVTREYHQAVRSGKIAHRKKVVLKKTEAKPTSVKVGTYLKSKEINLQKENKHA